MRTIAALMTAAALTAAAPAIAQTMSREVTAAVADAGRPEADKGRDAARKPGEVLAFAGVKPGQKVADLFPGGGYYTRILAKAVGPNGKVYAYAPTASDGLKAMAANYPNVVLTTGPLNEFKAAEPLDLVLTTENYHDFKNPRMGADTAVMNKAVFAALKKGGVYLISDHAAEAGSGLRDTGTLHRIDPAAVKTEVTAAGFRVDGESRALAVADDQHTGRVFDLHDKTDRFVLRFKKP